MYLKDALAAHKGIGPGFHFLRHALSIVILLHHLRFLVIGERASLEVATGGYTKGTLNSVTTYGTTVVELLRPFLFSLVGVFFALSGFLVMGSALRSNSVRVFFANRALRIIPALSVEVALSALIIGPIVTSHTIHDYFLDHQTYTYFQNIVGHVQYVLPGVFDGNPWPRIVNGSLWTLPPEFYCYTIMLAIIATGLLTHHRKLTTLALVSFAIGLGLNLYDTDYFSIRDLQTHFTNWYIVLLFCLGAAAYINSDKIYLNLYLFVFCGVAYWFCMMGSILAPLSGLFLTYCMIYAGFRDFSWFDRLVRDDLSYGIYLYGWPISQLTVWILDPHIGGMSTAAKLAIYAPLVLVAVCLFAKTSWCLIEKPALALRGRFMAPNPADLARTGAN